MDKEEHKKVIINFLNYLNKNSENYILKGGTALYLCYGLNRFSEDIDLNSRSRNIEKIIKEFCINSHYNYTIKKNTPTTQRYTIDYNNEIKTPLKIEVSHRDNIDNDILNKKINTINGIKVYSIDKLFGLKITALAGRDKIRDIFDICFIYNNYRDKINSDDIEKLQEALENKDNENYIDYLIKTQKDSLINEEILKESFIKMYLDIYDKEGNFKNLKKNNNIER